jgi:alpha-galactosidase
MPHELAGALQQADRIGQRCAVREPHIYVRSEYIHVAEGRISQTCHRTAIMQKFPDFVPAFSNHLKPLMRDGTQFTRMLFHPRIDGGIPLDSAVESQQFRSHRHGVLRATRWFQGATLSSYSNLKITPPLRTRVNWRAVLALCPDLMKERRSFMQWRTLLFICATFLCARELVSQETAAVSGSEPPVDTTSLALTPPMGWNSWDGYGTTINESQFRANAKWMAEHMKAFGWQYVTVDMEWFVANPTSDGNSRTFQYSLDPNGRYTPAVNRFPSAANGAGFKPLADYVHSLGLRFGIHILRGIPKQAVVNKIPIADSTFSAADGADASDTCPWNYDNFGTRPDQPAAQAYYDSIAKLYAGWGVDLIKVDCISSHPYKGDDIRMIRQALDKAGRPIVLSLSPGPAPVEKLDEMRQYAQMWRISDDIWDIWHNDADYPKGLGDQFGYVAKWAGKGQPGHWPDADMLPFGYLGPAAGWGKSRHTRLTRDEQRMLVTLWVIFPSPLMVGGDLTAADAWELSLLTNPEVIAVDQHSSGNHPVVNTDKVAIWLAKAESGNSQYLAIFNLTESKTEMTYEWKDLELREGAYEMRDLWEHKNLGPASALKLTLPAHGCMLHRVSAARAVGH